MPFDSTRQAHCQVLSSTGRLSVNVLQRLLYVSCCYNMMTGALRWANRKPAVPKGLDETRTVTSQIGL